MFYKSCFTTSGFTSLRAARERPEAPILSLSPDLSTLRQLTLAWGVHGVEIDAVTTIEDMVRDSWRFAQNNNKETDN